MDRIKQKASDLRDQLIIVYHSYKHKDTPWYAKIIAIIVVSYALSPIDLIPDFIPVIGYLDDLILIPIGIYITLKLIPKHVLLECKSMDLTYQRSIGSLIVTVLVIAVWGIILIQLLTLFW
jgi:uncharacterized membrane protein YkvA (DUF1232 family)